MKASRVTIRSLASLTLALFLQSLPAAAAWHQGTVFEMGFAYDGSTVTFVLNGWSRSNCTCYSPWPHSMCLQRSRASFKEEYAWLLAAKASDQVVNVFINETTCSVEAIYEQ